MKGTDGTGIIYTATVRAVNELTYWLLAQGLEVAPYHGRLKAAERSDSHERFLRGEVKAIVATSAFGMGIDKPDLRFVIHHHLPGTLEAYYQEAGRAGRDGEPAVCTLLFDPSDRKLHRFFQAGRHPDGSHLVNVHHALLRLSDQEQPPTLAELLAIAPVSKTRLQQVLRIFQERGIVRVSSDRRYTLVHRETTSEDLERLASASRERDERDRLKHEQMAAYADQRGCRWAFILSYFGQDEDTAWTCGHCDRCAPEAPDSEQTS